MCFFYFLLWLVLYVYFSTVLETRKTYIQGYIHVHLLPKRWVDRGFRLRFRIGKLQRKPQHDDSCNIRLLRRNWPLKILRKRRVWLHEQCVFKLKPRRASQGGYVFTSVLIIIISIALLTARKTTSRNSHSENNSKEFAFSYQSVGRCEGLTHLVMLTQYKIKSTLTDDRRLPETNAKRSSKQSMTCK